MTNRAARFMRELTSVIRVSEGGLLGVLFVVRNFVRMKLSATQVYMRELNGFMLACGLLCIAVGIFVTMCLQIW